MKKTKKIDYIIMAMVCILILNIGSLAINHDFPFDDYKSMDFSYAYKRIRELINPSRPLMEEVDVEDEIKSPKDIIIESLDDYQSLIIIKDSQGIKKIENIPQPLMVEKIQVNREDPYILIYHTHATESYLLAKEGDYRSSNKDENMVAIGDVLLTVLDAGGHKAKHIDIFHDVPSYNQSYSRSLNTISKEMDQSTNIKILLDLHRDAIADTSPNIDSIKKKARIEIEDRPVATFSLVVGPDSPNFDEVLGFAKYIKAVSDAVYPGLCTGIIIKPVGKYNQHLSDTSALIELGYHLNTLEEAMEGAKLVGEVLNYVLDGIIKE